MMSEFTNIYLRSIIQGILRVVCDAYFIHNCHVVTDKIIMSQQINKHLISLQKKSPPYKKNDDSIISLCKFVCLFFFKCGVDGKLCTKSFLQFMMQHVCDFSQEMDDNVTGTCEQGDQQKRVFRCQSPDTLSPRGSSSNM